MQGITGHLKSNVIKHRGSITPYKDSMINVQLRNEF
jgi:hypothetical protein